MTPGRLVDPDLFRGWDASILFGKISDPPDDDLVLLMLPSHPHHDCLLLPPHDILLLVRSRSHCRMESISWVVSSDCAEMPGLAECDF